MWRLLILAGFLSVNGFCAEADKPMAADLLPPDLPWSGPSEALVAQPGNPWITPAEETGLTETPDYAETIAYLRRLDRASSRVRMIEFGRTGQGRPLFLVVASREKAFSPQALRKTGKPALLAQAGIHSGEIDGKDAGLMLLRDIAFGPKRGLLDEAHFLFIPVLNPDGHERASEWSRPNQRGPVRQGWRTTGRNLNLNRDYMKADTPEMQALLRVLDDWDPALYLDLHVTDGCDYQYDITFGFNGEPGVPAWSPAIGDWLNRMYRPAVNRALEQMGHVPGNLVFELDGADLAKGLVSGPSMPRFSNGYGDLRHVPTVLVENHSLKSYRRRVLGTYVLLEASLRALGENGEALRRAIDTDRNRRADTVPMNWVIQGAPTTNRTFLGVDCESYTSVASGHTAVRWLGTPRFYPSLPVQWARPALELKRPKAYWVPGTHPEIIERLKRHGLRVETLGAARSLTVEMYRLEKPEPATTEGLQVYEGRYRLKTGVRAEPREETFYPGSVCVPVDQPLGDLAIVLLEPESLDSFFAWGFFTECLQRTEYIEDYVVAPMADRMLKADPDLKAAFEARLASDPKFASDPGARLQWFYERSPFHDDRYLLYPVGVER